MNRFGKKLFLWTLALTMALGAAVLGLPGGRAHADWNNPVIFSSTFQNKSMAGWTVNRPTWSIGNASGQYWLRTTAEVGENIAWAGQSHWSRYAVESKVRIEHPLGNGGILFRVTDANNFYLFRLNLATGKAELYKKTAGQLVLVKDAAYGASANVWYTLKAEVKGNEVHGYVDASKVLEWTNPSAELASGAIGLRSHTSPVSFGDVKVTRLAGDGTPADANIKYFGRWDRSDDTAARSYWSGAYLKVKFTGTTVKVRIGAPVKLYVSIDGGPDVLHTITGAGTVNLTPTPISGGTHTLRIANSVHSDSIVFEGLVLDPGQSTLPGEVRPALVEFIGDSLTAGYLTSKGALTDYAWLAAEQLGYEHTQVAYTGICLTDNINCFSPNGIGMSRQYFKLKTVLDPASPDWNFSLYTPDKVVVNLGTNDAIFNVSEPSFRQTQTAFLQQLRQKHPNARIYVMRPFKGHHAAMTQQAVQDRIAAGDTNIRYVDTTGWLTAGDYQTDGLHPNDVGMQKIANLLAPVLAQ